MLTGRSSGVLLHPTSLPGPYGIGDLGLEARRFVEWLAGAQQSYWQVLPLGPTAAGESPYQSPSAFGGNPWLISPELLFKDGLLTAVELMQAEIRGEANPWMVDFVAAIALKRRLLPLAAQRLNPQSPLYAAYLAFCSAEQSWLDDYAEFMVLREHNQNLAWVDWSQALSDQQRLSDLAREQSAAQLHYHKVTQFLFFKQWRELREFARLRGVRVIGDVPIYVSYDSADVWANRRLFQLNASGRSTQVAGVPPDYFSATGQLWMNPLYDWDAVAREGYRWWIDRLRAVLGLVDIVRIDHFRAFESYWSVPAGESTAIHGEWIPGPRDDFFKAIAHGLDPTGDGSLARLPLIAEDLGLITDEVNALRQRTELPGMKVLQFMLPADLHSLTDVEQLEPNSVCYTGTHDNDTSLGWYRSEVAPWDDRRERLTRFIGEFHEQDVAWKLVELCWKSGSSIAVAPLQDVLGLSAEHRMNTPGTFGDEFPNWKWRLAAHQLTDDVQRKLCVITRNTGRSH